MDHLRKYNKNLVSESKAVSSCISFFFFKQKTAYEIGVRLVGSEMCIRDRIDFHYTDKWVSKNIDEEGHLIEWLKLGYRPL